MPKMCSIVTVAILLAAGLSAAGGEPKSAPQRALGPKLVKAFLADCAAKAEAAREAETITVPGRKGWLFLSNELRHVGAGEFWGEAALKVSRGSKPDWADPLPAIVDFSDQLKARGISLIVVPVPPKAFVFPELISDAVPAPDGLPPRLDVHHQAFYKLLADRGVRVLDIWPMLAAGRFGDKGPMYCRTDTHWSGRACELVAARVAEILKEQDWYAAAPKREIAAETRKVEIDGDLRKAMTGDRPSAEALPLRFVGLRGSPQRPLNTPEDAPVLVLGDSHGLVFHIGGDMHARGAGFADQLAYELQMPVDVLAVRGSGATPARISLYRRSRSDAKYLDRKKAIVWCFSAREFTESTGWRPLPVAPDAKR